MRHLFLIVALLVAVVPDVCAQAHFNYGLFSGNKFTDTPGITVSNGDIYAADALEVDGATALDSTLVVAGAATFTGGITYAVTKSIWFYYNDFRLPSSAPASVSETGSMGALLFADSSADDHAWLTFLPPDDCNCGVDATLTVYYGTVLGSPAQGQWNFKLKSIADDAAFAVATTALDAIYDTPAAAGDMNVTTATTIPHANLVINQPTNIIVYHDVSDPFGGDAVLIGIRIDYTSSKP